MVAAMYETFFQMEHTPFSRNTPVADLYESPAMADTLGRLAYAADRQLFVRGKVILQPQGKEFFT